MGRPKRPRHSRSGAAVSDDTGCDSPETFAHATDRDCFNEVMRNQDSRSSEELSSSWLTQVQGIEHGTVCMNEGDTATSDQSTKDAVVSLAAQLSQVKRRLGPASDRCAEACNKFHETGVMDDGGLKTTSTMEFQRARRLCNPFEALGERQRGGLNNIFMNRAAIKLANIDALMDFQLTHFDGKGPFLFADICGAPGGFSEYIMYRCHANGAGSCRGYGMSLSGRNEHGTGLKWKPQHISRMIRESLQFRTCDGADGTGDVYHWENVEALREFIEEDLFQVAQAVPDIGIVNEVPSKGQVHLAVADGGFDAQRDSEYQEELAQKIVVCQAAAAVTLLKRGGTLVMKMFGFKTPTIQSVMRSFFHAFHRVTVLKPVSSRPASAERYVVFAGYKGTLYGWDGLAWRNSIFLGSSSHCERACFDSVDCEARLLKYLGKMDRDILTLNLKACFAILSCLERKYRTFTQGEDHTSAHQPRRMRPADIRMFRRKWRLENG